MVRDVTWCLGKVGEKCNANAHDSLTGFLFYVLYGVNHLSNKYWSQNAQLPAPSIPTGIG
jgi:hypothetical protein